MTVYTRFGGEVKDVLQAPGDPEGVLVGREQYEVELRVYWDDSDEEDADFYDWRNLKAGDGTAEIFRLFGWFDA